MEKTRIVIVDDSPFSVTLLSDVLTERGFDVVGSAGSLEEVRTVVKEQLPDVVTMDMTLPGTDGLECTKAVRAIDEKIKVIIVSSMMDDEIIKKAKNAGAIAYIQKPVDPDEITTTIKRATASEELFEILKEEYYTTFKESFADTFNKIVKKIPKFKDEGVLLDSFTSRGISVVIGIIGKYSGTMIIDTSLEEAKQIARLALRREPKDDNEVIAMMGEFANIVAGNASSLLNRKNKLFGFRVAPPSIFYGDNLNITTTKIDSSSMVAFTDCGEILLNVGFKRGEGQWI